MPTDALPPPAPPDAESPSTMRDAFMRTFPPSLTMRDARVSAHAFVDEYLLSTDEIELLIVVTIPSTSVLVYRNAIAPLIVCTFESICAMV